MTRFILTCLSILLLISGSLGAQQPANLPIESSTFVESAPIAPQLLDPSDRYWIVSSRECSQRLSQMRNCRLGVWEVELPSLFSDATNGEMPIRTQRCERNEAVFQQALIPGVPVVVFVHGSYISQERAVRYSRETFRWLRQAHPGQPLQFICYTWPSDPITFLPQVDFNELDDRAGVNGFYLSRVLHHIPLECPVSLIGHSQGAGTVVSALHLLGGGAIEGYRLAPEADRGHRVRLILAAAAIDHQWLNPGERYGQTLSRTETLLNLVNRRDWALGFYHLRAVNSGRAVSRLGFLNEDFQQMGPLAQKIQQLDVTRAIGRDHTWPSYYAVPALARSISDYVNSHENRVRRPIKVLTPPDTGQTRFAGGGETLQRAVSK